MFFMFPLLSFRSFHQDRISSTDCFSNSFVIAPQLSQKPCDIIFPDKKM
jgi:hypothetical protein